MAEIGKGLDMGMDFNCACEACGKVYLIRVKDFKEWYNMPPFHKCEAAA